MWGGSDRLFQCLTQSSQTIRVKVEVLVDGVVTTTLFGQTVVDPATGKEGAWFDGGVKVARSLVRRECDLSVVDLSLVDGDLTVNSARDLFSPLNSELRIWRGYQYWDASPYEIATNTGIEYWPLGTFLINRATMNWPTITLHGFDRLWNLRGRFQQPWPVAAGTLNMDALEALLVKFIPGAQLDYDLPTTSNDSPALVWEQQDVIMDRANNLATADGLILYADPMGTIRAVPPPVADIAHVVWMFQPGSAAIHAQPTRDIDATDAENVVVASGESDGSTPPVFGIAKDLNPDSYTYIGRTAEVARFFSSPLLKTQGQCAQAAKTILYRELGVTDSVVIPSVPIPALEGGDVIALYDPKIQVDDVFIADEFTIPLRANGVMEINCRSQKV